MTNGTVSQGSGRKWVWVVVAVVVVAAIAGGWWLLAGQKVTVPDVAGRARRRPRRRSRMPASNWAP